MYILLRAPDRADLLLHVHIKISPCQCLDISSELLCSRFYMLLLTLLMLLTNHYRNETHEVIKYLEFCIKDLHNEDPGVHNLLLSLYAMKVLSFYSPCFLLFLPLVINENASL